MSTSYLAIVLALLLVLIFVAFRVLARGRALLREPAWDGGLRRLWSRITYTATGFSNPVRVVFTALLQPGTVADSTEAVAGHFRTAIRREYSETPIIDRWILRPPVYALGRTAQLVRRIHVGNVNAYAAYMLVALLLALAIGIGLL